MPSFVDCLILVGASDWPHLEYLETDKGFAVAHLLARDTLARALCVEAARILDLFDSTSLVQDQYGRIKTFLRTVTADDRVPNDARLRVVTYFIGHGGMYGDSIREYCLPLRSTEEPYESISSLRMRDLANTLASAAPRSLRVTIIDACFAGKALSAFQGQDQQMLDAAADDALDPNPTDWGNVLICASDHRSPAVLEDDGAGTKFTSALTDAIALGDVKYGEYLSLKDVVEITKRLLGARTGTAVPQLHVPRQASNSYDVTQIPFLSNQAFVALGARTSDLDDDRLFSVQPDLVSRSSGNFIEYRGTVFDVADGNSFWNQLAPEAKQRFVLLGRTNKNWIRKSPKEARRLGLEIVRILEAGGEVVILSSPDAEVVTAHTGFFLKHVGLAKLEEYSVGASPALSYRTVTSSAYGAIVADDRLIFLPSLNSEHFWSEAIVLEFTRHESPQPYENYMADIERLIDNSPRIELVDVQIPTAPNLTHDV